VARHHLIRRNSTLAYEPLHVSFDDGFGPISNAWNVDASTPGEVKLAGQSAMMEWAVGREAGHGYGTYTINAKVDGNQPGAGIILWPGDNKWPGQEIDMVEVTPDGSGRHYGTVHWDGGGHDNFDAKIFDGVYGGVFHDYTMVWEPGRITMKVDGAEKATWTDHVPVDFANGGMNNTIGFLNNNPNTSITVRDVTYTPPGGSAPSTPPAAPAEAPAPSEPTAEVAAPAAVEQQVVEQNAAEPVAAPADSAPIVVATDSATAPAAAPHEGYVDWNALAAEVMANYEATGQWFTNDPSTDLAYSTSTSEHVDWNAIAAQVTANFEATGQWFL
jgi:hypothetical protein